MTIYGNIHSYPTPPEPPQEPCTYSLCLFLRKMNAQKIYHFLHGNKTNPLIFFQNNVLDKLYRDNRKTYLQ